MTNEQTRRQTSELANLAVLVAPLNPALRLLWPDNHHAKSAAGWIELGDLQSATEELIKINPNILGHPFVARIRIRILSDSRQFELAMAQARDFIEHLPNDPHGWISCAFALHALKRTQEAYDLLFPMIERFPQERTIPYNLACYLSQLGRLNEACRMLERSLAIDGGIDRNLMALCDPDLAPLWEEKTLRWLSSQDRAVSGALAECADFAWPARSLN